MRKKLLLLFLILAPFLYAQNTNWQIAKSRLFKANNLYGHINGGSELFLELGFKTLNVDYYSNSKSELVVEIYEMESPESALAIYLQKCGKESSISSIKARNTGDRFQIMCVKGSKLLSINNSGGNKALFQDMIKIANSNLEKIKISKNVDLLNLLPKKNLVKGSETIFRGMYSLQSIYTFGEGDVLLQKGRIFGTAADYKDSGNNYTLLLVKYPSIILASAAYNNIVVHLDNTKKITNKNKNYLVFRDHSGKFGSIKLEGDMVEMKVNMSSIK